MNSPGQPESLRKIRTKMEVQNRTRMKLVAGTYILKEVSAPFGYLMADPITFTVGFDGKLSSKAEGAVSNDENKAVVIMKDVAKEKSVSSSISVTKRLKTVAGEDILAADQTFYVAALCRPGMYTESIRCESAHVQNGLCIRQRHLQILQ